ncbi:MAG: DNA-binding response regulator, partial [Acinetobacter sp.]
MHILIVEDEVKIAEYLAKGLSESGYSTAIAENGVLALACLQQQ